MVADVVIITAVSFTFESTRLALEPDYANTSNSIARFGVMISIWFGAMFFGGAYNLRYLGTGVPEFKVVIHSSFQGFLLLCATALATHQQPSRIILFLSWFGSVALVTISRKLLQMRLLAERRVGKSLRNTLILGSMEYAATLTSKFRTNPQYGFQIVGCMPLHTPDSKVTDTNWLATIDQGILEKHIEVLIIQDPQGANAELMSAISWHFNQKEVEMLVVPTFLHQFGPRLELEPHPELPLVYLDEPDLTNLERILKRTMDVVLSSIAILLTLPAMLLIAVGVYVSNPGPIFFIQKRVGLHGVLFRFIKFRSMVVGAENMRQDILGTPDDEMIDRYRQDPRIYPFGRFIRRFSFDELPQLFSVLVGSMSLVGPRPLLIEELDLLGDEDHRRHLTKPGLTGLWQINGRKETTWDERIQLALEYVHNWSLGLDLGIILKTVKVVATGEGAY